MAGKRGIEAGRAYVRATMDDSLFRKGLTRIKSGLMGLGRALPAIASGIFIFKQIGAAVQTAANKVTEAIEDLAAIDKVRKAFGATAEQASGLFGVFKASGAENARENIESLVTLSGRITDVLSGTGKESKKLFKGLTISAKELAGLPIDEQFFKLHEAIMKLPDPMDRVNRLMLAFGEDGGKTLIGTLSMSTEELRRQAKGFQVTSEEMENANKAQKAMAALNATVAKTWQRIAIVVAPFIVQAVDGLFKITHWVSEWVRQNAALQASLEVLRTLLGAAAVGEWMAAWKVAAAALRATFAEGIEWIQGKWIDLKEFMASAFIDLGAKIETIWSGIFASIATLFGESLAKMVRMAEAYWQGIAIGLGIGTTGQGIDFSGIANNIQAGAGVVANNASGAAGKIEDNRKSAQQTLAEDMARERKSIDAGSAEAAAELARALEDAKAATEAATAKQEEITPPGTPPPNAVKAETAVNAALQVGSSEANDFLSRMQAGAGKDDAKALQKQGNKHLATIEKEIKRWDRIVITPGETR
jgi:hypothetical protein